MPSILSVCVYCGSRVGTDPTHKASATRLGQALGEAGIQVVYGGGRIGLMGVVADACMAAGGKVVGIIPEHLHDHEVGHHGVTDLRIVANMHERKNLMFELSDAFITLPGGIGSMDETFEIITWKQLRLHDKPIIVVNERGYWTPFLNVVDHIIANDFASPSIRELFTVVDDIEAVLPALAAAPAPALADRPERL